MPAQDRHRDLHIDGLRGLAVILVVLGHAALQPYFHDTYALGRIAANGMWRDPASYSGLLGNLIYSFHMPLFAFVSGLLAARTLRPPLDMLRRRFASLMVPYFAWAVVVYVAGFAAYLSPLHYTAGTVQIPPLQYLLRVVIDTDTPGAAWFLYALFMCFVLLAIARSTPRPELTLGILVMAAVVLSCTPWGNSSFLSAANVELIFPFFALGVFLDRRCEWMQERRGVLIAVAALSYVLLMWLAYPVLDITGMSRWYASFASWMNASHVPGAFVVVRVLIYGCAAAGVLLTYLVFSFVWGSVLDVFVWFGRRSLGIYVVQGIVLGPLIARGITSTVPLFVLALAISAATTVALEQLALSRRILLGQRAKPEPAFRARQRAA